MIKHSVCSICKEKLPVVKTELQIISKDCDNLIMTLSCNHQSTMKIERVYGKSGSEIKGSP